RQAVLALRLPIEPPPRPDVGGHSTAQRHAAIAMSATGESYEAISSGALGQDLSVVDRLEGHAQSLAERQRESFLHLCQVITGRNESREIVTHGASVRREERLAPQAKSPALRKL